MPLDEMDRSATSRQDRRNIDIAIRFGLLALLAYWSWEVVAPFLTILLWSAILAVALYPLFDRLKGVLNRPKLSAALVTLLCVLLVLAPVAWLGVGMISGVKYSGKRIRSRTAIPCPYLLNRSESGPYSEIKSSTSGPVRSRISRRSWLS